MRCAVHHHQLHSGNYQYHRTTFQPGAALVEASDCEQSESHVEKYTFCNVHYAHNGLRADTLSLFCQSIILRVPAKHEKHHQGFFLCTDPKWHTTDLARCSPRRSSFSIRDSLEHSMKSCQVQTKQLNSTVMARYIAAIAWAWVLSIDNCEMLLSVIADWSFWTKARLQFFEGLFFVSCNKTVSSGWSK